MGAVDDLWAFGKPRGRGGPWQDTAVKAGQPSDAYLATGYDRKRLTLRHQNSTPVSFTVEADFTGTGAWSEVVTLIVPCGKPVEYRFPDAFGAYWLRIVPSADAAVTAQFDYD